MTARVPSARRFESTLGNPAPHAFARRGVRVGDVIVGDDGPALVTACRANGETWVYPVARGLASAVPRRVITALAPDAARWVLPGRDERRAPR